MLSSFNTVGAALQGANLSGKDLTFTVFPEYVQLEATNFSGADLKFAQLPGARLTNANFRNATVTGASFVGATWSNTTCPNGSKTNSGCSTTVVQARVGTGSPVTTKAEHDATFEQMMRLQEEMFRSYEEILRL